MNGGRWLSVREAARQLGVHENTVRNMLDDARLVGRTRPGTAYREVAEASVTALGGSPAMPPTYHDLHITTPDIPRTSIFNLPYGVENTCNRVGGWCAWRQAPGSTRAEVQIGAEYPDIDEATGEASNWLILDVAGHVIVNSRDRAPEGAAE